MINYLGHIWPILDPKDKFLVEISVWRRCTSPRRAMPRIPIYLPRPYWPRWPPCCAYHCLLLISCPKSTSRPDCQEKFETILFLIVLNPAAHIFYSNFRKILRKILLPKIDLELCWLTQAKPDWRLSQIRSILSFYSNFRKMKMRKEK